MASHLEKVFKAQTAHLNGLVAEAIKLYSEVLQAEPENYDLLVHRAIVYTSDAKFEEAIRDCEEAILADKTRSEAYYRRGVAYFLSGKVNPALIDFEEALGKTKENAVKQQLNIWVAKCRAEKTNKKFQDYKPGVAAETKVEATSSASQVQADKPAYKWYQTNAKVGIEIKFVLDNKEKITHSSTARHFEISFPISSGRDFSLSLDLFDDIVPENTIVNVNLSNIEIFLEKRNKTQNWAALEAPLSQEKPAEKETKPLPVHDSQPKPLNINATQPPSYPSSSKVKRDWNKLDKEIEEELKKEGGTGEDPTNAIFRQIYESGDENMKRAMIKSMQTSGGTVLSTNWDEVKDKDYTGKDRPEAPQGQEWRKWEK